MEHMQTLVDFIKVVERYPKLYTNITQSSDVHDKEWAAVANECKMTISEAQEQWSVLLMEYIEYLKSNEDFGLSMHMDFLQSYFFEINDGVNIDEMELVKAIDTKSSEGTNASYMKHTKSEDNDLKAYNNMQKNIKIENADKNETPRITSHSNEPDNSRATQQNSSFTNLSSLELIFLGYAKQLQKMPLPLQLKTKRKIANIMDDAELQVNSLVL